MTTFLIMRTRIADELHRTDLTTQVNRAIETAIDHWESQRFFFNEGFATFSTVASTQTYSAGNASLTNVLAVNQARLTVNNTRQPLVPWTWQQLIDENISTTQTGVPDYYVWYASNIIFYPVPSATYTAELTVTMRFPEVSASSSDAATNVWMTSAETLIRQRAKAIVRTDYLRDPLAIQEASALAGTPFISTLEKSAYDRLVNRSEAQSTGRLVPTKF